MFQLSVISIPVSDLGQAEKFYGEQLGMTKERDGDLDTPHGYVLMRAPAGTTAISLVKGTDKMPVGSMQGMFLSTLDVDRAVESLTARGLSTSSTHSVSWGRFVTFVDPDGNGWILAEPAF